jgi:DNA-nicking Smr family endonuclease
MGKRCVLIIHSRGQADAAAGVLRGGSPPGSPATSRGSTVAAFATARDDVTVEGAVYVALLVNSR